MTKFISFCLSLLPLFAISQYRDYDSNRIGINAGLNQFTPYTDDFKATPGTGWNAGLSLRGNFYNDFDMVYGIQFSEANFTAETIGGEEVKYKLSAVQISLLLSYKIAGDHFSVEIGPMLQVNGDLTYDDGIYEDVILKNSDYTADEISKTSRFGFYPTVGITGGLSRLRLSATYQYGVTNLMKSSGAKVNGGYLSGNIIFYL